MTLDPFSQPFPSLPAPLAEVRDLNGQIIGKAYIEQIWLQLLIALWTRTGGAVGLSIELILLAVATESEGLNASPGETALQTMLIGVVQDEIAKLGLTASEQSAIAQSPLLGLLLDGPAVAEPALLMQQLSVGSFAIALATGDGQGFFFIPPQYDSKNLIAIYAALAIAQSTAGTVDVQIARVRAGVAVDVLSTKLTIDANEWNSTTAATAAVIDPANQNVLAGDLMRIDIDAVGVASQGLLVTMVFG